MLCTASILNLLMISLDRYFAVTTPLRYRQVVTPSRVAVGLVIIWAVSLMVSFLPIHLGWNTNGTAVQNTTPNCTKTCDLEVNPIYGLVDCPAHLLHPSGHHVRHLLPDIQDSQGASQEDQPHVVLQQQQPHATHGEGAQSHRDAGGGAGRLRGVLVPLFHRVHVPRGVGEQRCQRSTHVHRPLAGLRQLGAEPHPLWHAQQGFSGGLPALAALLEDRGEPGAPACHPPRRGGPGAGTAGRAPTGRRAGGKSLKLEIRNGKGTSLVDGALRSAKALP
uniref:Histamine receptor H2 n=1 Tax=Anas platyrhynchos TaxID=8839 RepID=A0A8B9T659_ANAPL